MDSTRETDPETGIEWAAYGHDTCAYRARHRLPRWPNDGQDWYEDDETIRAKKAEEARP